jgi:glycosyltransferase involved in cell wall biosynthesis
MSTISVIISTYQHGNTIARTLDALLNQTRQADQIVLVDDGSTDQTREVIQHYLDRITYVSQANAGGPAARNNGFRHATGDLVLFCDADVVMKPNMLERLESTLATHPSASYAYCRFRWGWKRFSCRPFDAVALRKRNFIHTSAALIRREYFPGFDESLKKFQDWDVWLTMLERGHVGVFVDEELYVVEQDRGRMNISSWLPSFVYAIPWNALHWKPKQIRRYDEAKAIIQAKHPSDDV